jgi:5-formyltetrahydrofolate cyclo-ligase
MLADAAGLLRPGRRVGLYLASAEELDSKALLARAHARGCSIHLPRITSVRHARMRFFTATGATRAGPWGMMEPAGGRPVRARELDLVFLPLVGFDDAGHRIGMGKGFYDRHFAHRRVQHQWRVPLLIGVAY